MGGGEVIKIINCALMDEKTGFCFIWLDEW